jgi:tRNA pseudouridine32 synthase/23S rRNA pseudouridine746 synthase
VYDPVHGKPGRTRFEVIAFEPGFAATRVRFWPQTGRTHQLRLHAAHPLGLGHAILGDRLYGDVGSAPRLMLHAERVTLVHPQRGDTVGFCAPVPF